MQRNLPTQCYQLVYNGPPKMWDLRGTLNCRRFSSQAYKGLSVGRRQDSCAIVNTNWFKFSFSLACLAWEKHILWETKGARSSHSPERDAHCYQREHTLLTWNDRNWFCPQLNFCSSPSSKLYIFWSGMTMFNLLEENTYLLEDFLYDK